MQTQDNTKCVIEEETEELGKKPLYDTLTLENKVGVHE